MESVTIVDVSPRDGFQSVVPFIPTVRKIEIIQGLVDAGLRRIEVGSFVSRTALPQMRDIEELLAGMSSRTDAELSVLVPNFKGAELAMKAGNENLVTVFSASETHNANNVRKTVQDSLVETRRILEELQPKGRIRINIATAFDCPFEGRMPLERVLPLVEQVMPWAGNAEIALCDTTGRALPVDVAVAFDRCIALFGPRNWAYHAHDTYGLGTATNWTAYEHGVRIFDASAAGLGGCPFAPGATGNVATEDTVFLFENSGVATGVDLDRLLSVATSVTQIEGGAVGGRVRAAMEARSRLGLSGGAPAKVSANG
ncbi:hydroxymethylglutaryl-CoA lyase [Shinella sp. BYT-45]|uniref:hydroxymethylglutaryl-CoA lyase n=1 Tax=Shinella sp. BYT-45 TaxID=3377377 RepID=UPI0039800606